MGGRGGKARWGCWRLKNSQLQPPRFTFQSSDTPVRKLIRFLYYEAPHTLAHKHRCASTPSLYAYMRAVSHRHWPLPPLPSLGLLLLLRWEQRPKKRLPSCHSPTFFSAAGSKTWGERFGGTEGGLRLNHACLPLTPSDASALTLSGALGYLMMFSFLAKKSKVLLRLTRDESHKENT